MRSTDSYTTSLSTSSQSQNTLIHFDHVLKKKKRESRVKLLHLNIKSRRLATVSLNTTAATQLTCLQTCSWQTQSGLFHRSCVSCSRGFLLNFFQRNSVTKLHVIMLIFNKKHLKRQLLHFPHLCRVGRNLCGASGASSES